MTAARTLLSLPMRNVLISSSIVFVSLVFARAERAQTPPANIDFVRDVQPIFRQHCYECHGPTQQQNGFRLDRRSSAMRGGTITVIGPGNSDGSRLFQRLIGSSFGRQMPPDGALGTGDVATIQAWIDQGAHWPDAAANETPPPPPNPIAGKLIDALAHGDRNAFTALARANRGAGSLRGPDGTTPLMVATLESDVASMTLLLDNGADPNARNDAGATALMWAVTDVAKTRLLLTHGANVNARSDDGRTALIVASGLHGAADVVALLLEKGADPSLRAPGASPLIEATFAGDPAVFQQLVSHGADLAASRSRLLAQAVQSECASCAEALFKSVPSEDATTGMFMAGPPRGQATHTKVFLDHGAKASAVAPDGRTMLMLDAASDDPSLDVARALIGGGVDVNAVSQHGESALGLALQHGSTPLVDLLRRSGAKDVPGPAGPPASASPASSAQVAVTRALPLLQQNDETFLRKAGCVSCHNNTLTAMTIAAARTSGLPVNETIAKHQKAAIGVYLETWRERALQGMTIPGDSDTVSYILAGLAAETFAPTPATDAMARVLLRQQRGDHWAVTAHRPPLESSDIEVTALSMRSLQVYRPASLRAEADRAVSRTAAWIGTRRSSDG